MNPESDRFYLLKEGTVQEWGPVTFEDLLHGKSIGVITPETWIQPANGGMVVRARQIRGLFPELPEDAQRRLPYHWNPTSEDPGEGTASTGTLKDIHSSGIQSPYPRGSLGSVAPKRGIFSMTTWSWIFGLVGLFIWPCAPVGILFAQEARRRGEPGGGIALGFCIGATAIMSLMAFGWCAIIFSD